MQTAINQVVTGVKRKTRAVNYIRSSWTGKLISWYTFLMAFPAIVVFQNLSVYVFPFLVKSYSNIDRKTLSVKYFANILALLFGIAAILSVFLIPDDAPAGSFSRALRVLPNYLYWVVLVIFIVNIRGRLHDSLVVIYKAIFWGVVASCLYYFIFQNYLTGLIIFKRLTQNAFGFLLICFSPMAVYYAMRRWGKPFGYMSFFTFTVLGLLSGSRSASILVFTGSMGAIMVSKIQLRNLIYLATIALLVYLVIFEVSTIRPLMYSLNKRTYDLLYNRDETLRTDRSYLVRLAMVEKALELHKKHPYTGIGLNNFANYYVVLPGDFQGSEYVINKDGLNEASVHNSYMGLLSEGGLFLLVPFLCIQLFCVLTFIVRMNRIPPYVKPVFLGFIYMSVHLYFIMAIVNVFAWFLIALTCAFVTMTNRNEFRRI